MSENAGWIKLHRCLLSKAIWKCSTPEQCKLLITLLLLANHEPNQWMWKGEKYTCNPGEFITSSLSLSKTTGLTRQQVRTALDKFEKLDFLTTETTNKSTKITIVNWGFYQGQQQQSNQQTNKQATNKQPTSNQQVTTNKNDKNDKNDKKLFKAHNRFDNFEQRENVIKVEDLFFNQVGEQDEL